ncbi:MAG: hypothetical protein U5J63_15010 [Fodinibius sp.]|nr:hypothetical protein [Fodinibius sp.]
MNPSAVTRIFILRTSFHDFSHTFIFVVMYFLVKIISRLFLQSKQQQKRKKGNTMYRIFQQFAQQQQRQNQSQRQNDNRSGSPNDKSSRFEEIEEAEFEEITDDEEKTSKSSD